MSLFFRYLEALVMLVMCVMMLMLELPGAYVLAPFLACVSVGYIWLAHND